MQLKTKWRITFRKTTIITSSWSVLPPVTIRVTLIWRQSLSQRTAPSKQSRSGGRFSLVPAVAFVGYMPQCLCMNVWFTERVSESLHWMRNWTACRTIMIRSWLSARRALCFRKLTHPRLPEAKSDFAWYAAIDEGAETIHDWRRSWGGGGGWGSFWWLERARKSHRPQAIAPDTILLQATEPVVDRGRGIRGTPPHSFF